MIYLGLVVNKDSGRSLYLKSYISSSWLLVYIARIETKMSARDSQEAESPSPVCSNYLGSAEESIPAGVKFVRSTSTLGRKRVVLSKSADFSPHCGSSSSPKKLCRRSTMERSNHLEALPLDVLVKILCKVDHSDLSQLLLLSKTLSQATSIAKEMHFAFATPISNRVSKEDADGHEEEAPNAPIRHRVTRSRLSALSLSSITAVLFPSRVDQ
ncbi:F-box protein At1g61340-like isoform X2 [Zingiber officinale]|uniref:F-box domain-containing protein n=1 Tax=Zingiber officinale TaxID=94328 RepID=A0A8J5EP69_ZINOF|nr:F-box protein At1g61340-like isoform X2 [Zingiber officinale]KAG6471015.1 hypothetical protein ZIOFF_072107 [Zingiber officinale]